MYIFYLYVSLNYYNSFYCVKCFEYQFCMRIIYATYIISVSRKRRTKKEGRPREERRKT